jgi:GT2 family glycosyltransferase
MAYLPSRGDLLAAYAVADRRCRSAAASAHDFIVRARLSRAAGEVASALSDFEAALELDPANFEANLAAMQWGAVEGRATAAARVIAGEGRDVRGLREAIRLKLDDGAGVVHRLRPSAAGVSGWLAWLGHEALTLGLEDSEGEWAVAVAPDPSLALAGEGYAVVEIEIADVIRVFDPRDGSVLFRRRISTAFADRRAEAPPGAAALSVIIPIYDGFEATQACLNSLFSQQDIVFSTILIDDGSPDPRLSALAEAASLRSGVTLLRNHANLGFAESINRGLAISATDDVVLLNSDTILPSRAMARLHALVADDPSVGTATPFSNNSQLTSFPRPFAVNELPTPGQVGEIDEIAFAVNGTGLVDVPTGIGFCLYISRACLDATGPLPVRYGRGYYEDAEFCMIARQRGFRNVCATGVFVGHAGSISFKSDKGALISRNLAILDERFPRQGEEYLAFAQADPLRFARAAMEEWLPPEVECTLIVASEGRVHWQARQRSRGLHARGEAAVLLLFSPEGDRVELRRAEEGAPASLQFPLDQSGQRRLRTYLRRLKVRAVEIFDAARAPAPLTDALFALGAPTDLFCVDLWAMRGAAAPRFGPCETPLESQPCRSCVADYAAKADTSRERERQTKLAQTISAARGVRSVDRMGFAFATRIFGAKAGAPEPEVDETYKPPSPGSIVDQHVLGVLAPVASAECDRLLVRLSRKLRPRGDGFRIVVLGSCLNEAEITATGSAVVVGSGDRDEYARVARIYGVGRLALFERTSLFGALDRLAVEIGAPKAYFDWSFGALEARSSDLVIDPRVCDEKAASAVAAWLSSD